MRLVVVLMLLVATDLAAAPLSESEAGRVVDILSGETLRLEDGRTLRLLGILAPTPPPGWPAAAPWRMAEAAKAALGEIALGRTVTLSRGAAETDRYGRILAHLWRADGIWIEGEMLRRGMARVAGAPDDRALIADMLGLEAAARAERRGLWADHAYAVRRPGEAGRLIESFELVEGRVTGQRRVKGQLLLDLASEGEAENALVLRLSREAQALFRAASSDPRDLVGAFLRVRGWIVLDRRPLIEVTYPEQIERLSSP